MDTLDRVRVRLKGIPLSELQGVVTGSGVKFGTLVKIKYGTTKNPRFKTVSKLDRFFCARQKRTEVAA